MTTLQNLTLEFDADFSRLDAQLKQAERRAEGIAKKIERSYKISIDDSAIDKLQAKLNKLNNTKIDPDVDIYSGVGGGGGSPKPPTSGSGGALPESRELASAIERSFMPTLKSIEGSLKVIANKPVRVTTQVVVSSKGDAIAKAKLAGQMLRNTRSIQSQTKYLGGFLNRIAGNTRRTNPISAALTGILKTTLGSSLRGGFEQLGRNFTQTVTKETLKTDKGKAAKASFDKAAARTGEIGINALESVGEIAFGGSKLSGNALDVMADDILEAVEFMLDPAVFIKKANAFRNYAINLSSKIEAGRLNDFELMKTLVEDAFAFAPRQIGNATFRGAQVAALPLKVKKEVETAKAARLLDDFVADFSKATRLLSKQIPLTDLGKADNVIAVSAGFERKGGDNSQALLEMLRAFTDEKTEFLQIKNTFTDRFKGDPQSKIFEAAKATLEPMGISVGGELKSMLSNLEVNIDTAFKGMNTDAIKLAALISALESLFPHLKLSMAGFSGGGFPVEQAIAIMQARGNEDVKGVGIGTPLHGLTDTATANQFKAVLGKIDPLTATLSKFALDINEADQAKVDEALKAQGNSNAEKLSNLAVARPGESQSLVDGTIFHDVWSYLGNPNSYKELQGFLSGMRTLEATLSKETVPAEIAAKYENFFDILGEFVDPFLSSSITRTAVARGVKTSAVLDPKNQGGLEGIKAIADKTDRSDKEEKILQDYLANVFEAATSKEIGVMKAGIKRIKRSEGKAKQAEILSANPELDAKQVKKDVANFIDDLFDSTSMGKAFNRLTSLQEQALDFAASEAAKQLTKKQTKGLDNTQTLAAATLQGKRRNDDQHLLRSLDIYRNNGTSDIDSGYEFFNFENPLAKLGTEFQGFLDFVITPVSNALKGSNLEGQGADYERFLLNLQAGFARFIATGEKLPEEFVNAAEQILSAEDKLGKIEFPDLLDQGVLKPFENYKKDLVAGGAKLAGSFETESQPANDFDREQLSLINEQIKAANKSRSKKEQQPLIDIDNAFRVGAGQLGTAIHDKTNDVVIKIKSDKLDPIASAADNFGKEFPTLKPVLDAAKGLVEVADSVEMFADEQERYQKVIDAGLAQAPSQSQPEGGLFMPFIEGTSLADKAGVLTGDDDDAIKEFITDLVKAGQLLSEFHKKQLLHGDFHLGNVLKGEDGNLQAVDFGKVEDLPSDSNEASKAIGKEIKGAVQATIGLLASKGINVNPEVLRAGLRAGVAGKDADETAEAFLTRFENSFTQPEIEIVEKKASPQKEERVLLPDEPTETAKLEAAIVASVNNTIVTIESLESQISALIEVQSELVSQQKKDTEVKKTEEPKKEEEIQKVDAELVQDNKAVEIVKSATKALGESVMDAAKQTYLAASVIEEVFLSVTPGLRTAKSVTKGLLPAGAAVGLTLAIPGGAELIGMGIHIAHGITAGLSGGVADLAAGGITNLLTEVGSGTAGLLAESIEATGVAGSHILAEAVTVAAESVIPTVASAGGAVAGTAVGTGAEVVLGVGALATGINAVNKAADNLENGLGLPQLEAAATQISGNLQEANKKIQAKLKGDKAIQPEVQVLSGSPNGQKALQAAVEEAATETRGIVKEAKYSKKALKSFGKIESAARKESKSLDKQIKATDDVNLKKVLRRNQIKLLENTLIEGNKVLGHVKGDAKASQVIARQKGTLENMLKAKIKKAEAEGVSGVGKADFSIGTQRTIEASGVVALPEIVAKKKEEAEKEGDNYADGFIGKLESRTAEFEIVGEDVGKSAVQGLKKGLDSHSPAKETEEEGDNYADGFILRLLKRARDAFNAGHSFAGEALDGLDLGIRELQENVGLRPRTTPIRETFGDSNASIEEQAGGAVGAGAAQLQDLLRDVVGNLGGFDPEIEAFFQGFTDGFTDVSENSILAASEIAAFGTAVGFIAFHEQILDIGSTLFDVAKEVEVVRKKLTSIGISDPDFFSRFGDQAKAAGADIFEFADQYADMVAALEGKVVDPDKLFGDLTKGLNARGVVGENLDGSITALSQIAGKGVVSMEELRQQLGDRLPNAIGISAKAMGLTTQEMISLVSSGELLASDFLPKLADELNNVAVATGVSLNKELAELGNHIKEIQVTGADQIPFAEGVKVLNFVVRALKGGIEPLVTLLKGAMIGAFVNLGIHTVRLIKSIKLLDLAMKGVGKTTGAVVGIALVSSALIDLDKTLLGSTRNVQRLIDRLNDLENRKGGGDVESRFESSSGIGRIVDKGANALNDFGESLGLGRNVSTYAENELANFNDIVADAFRNASNLELNIRTSITQESIDSVEEDLAPLKDQQLSLNTRLANADLLGIELEDQLELRKELKDVELKIKVRMEAFADKDGLSEAISTYESLIDEIELKIKNNNASEDDFFLLKAIKAAKKEANETLKIINQASNPITSDIADAEDAFGQLKAQQEFDLANNSALGLADTLDRMMETGARSATLSAANAQQEIANLNARVAATQELSRAQRDIVEAASLGQREVLEEILGTSDFESASVAELEDARQVFEEIEEGGGTADPQIKLLLDALVELKNLGTQEIEASNAQKQAVFDQKNAIRDLQESIPAAIISSIDTALALQDFIIDLEKSGTGIRNVDLVNSDRAARDAALESERFVEDQAIVWRDFSRSIEDAGRNIQDATRDLANEIKGIQQATTATNLGAANTYLDAAGFNNFLGLNQIPALASERAEIEADDSAEQTARARKDKQRDTKRQIEDFREQKKQLERDKVDDINRKNDAIVDLKQEILDLQDEQRQLPQRQQREVLELNDRIAREYRDYNEKASIAREQGQSLDPDYESSLTTQNEIDSMGQNIAENFRQEGQAIERRIANAYSRIERLQDDKNAISQRTQSNLNRVDGNISDLGARQVDFDNESRKKEALQRKQKAARIRENDGKLEGTFENIIDSLPGKLLEVQQQAENATKATAELYKEIGKDIGVGIDPYLAIQADADIRIGQQIDTLAKEKKQLEFLMDTVGKSRLDGTSDIGDARLNIESIIRNSGLDKGIEGNLLSRVSTLKTQEDWLALMEGIDSTYSEIVDKHNLLTSEEDFGKQVAEFQKAKDQEKADGQLDDSRVGFLDAVISADHPGTQDREIRKLKLKRDELSLNRQLIRDKEAIEAAKKENPLLNEQELINLATQKHAVLLAKARKEATLMFEVMEKVRDAGKTAIADSLLGIGEALISNNQAKEESSKLDSDYADRLSQLTEEYAGNADELLRQKQTLDEQRDDIQNDINTKLSTTARIFDVLKGALAGFAKAIANVAAQIAATTAIKGIASIFGGGSGGGIGSAISSFFTAQNGGEVPTFMNGGEIGNSSLLRAMNKEGINNAVPIVASRGEQVLSTKNKDAQAFRAMQRNGMWAEAKSSLGTYMNGGTIGGSTVVPSASRSRGVGGSNQNNYYKTEITVNTPNATSFNKSKDQMYRETQSRQSRVATRGLA